jgi:hypothetical protein
MTKKKLLENIYFAALHLKNLNNSLANDLLRDDIERARAKGAREAYAYIVLMILHSQSIGSADYKKVFDMKENCPDL